MVGKIPIHPSNLLGFMLTHERLRSRRGYLAAVSVAISTLTGCAGQSPSSPETTGPGNTEDGQPSPQTSSSADSEGVGGHPAGEGLSAQPVIGDLSETSATIIAFEDPSCPRCRAFEQEVVPQIRSNLVDPGKAAFVFRGYPVVYSWGEPACHALEAAVTQSRVGHFELAEHYFTEQDSFSIENVVDRTRQFVESETALDVEPIAMAAAERTEKVAVQTDLDAGMTAGAGQITPTLFLFKEGEYLTKASGSVSYDLIAAALEV
jgi:protein-disulfide isomerase